MHLHVCACMYYCFTCANIVLFLNIFGFFFCWSKQNQKSYRVRKGLAEREPNFSVAKSRQVVSHFKNAKKLTMKTQ